MRQGVSTKACLAASWVDAFKHVKPHPKLPLYEIVPPEIPSLSLASHVLKPA